jgi:hypothetical protein
MEDITTAELLDFFDVSEQKIKDEQNTAVQVIHHKANLLVQSALKDPSLPIKERETAADTIIHYFQRLTNEFNLVTPTYLIDQLKNQKSTTDILDALPYMKRNLGDNTRDNYLPDTTQMNLTSHLSLGTTSFAEPVIQKVPSMTINSFNNEYTAGTINPLKKKILKRHINVNTKFRKNYMRTVSTDFTLQLSNTLKNVVSFKLASAEIWNSYYNISRYYGNDEMKIHTYDISNNIIINDETTIIQIQRGYYTLDGLASYLNNDVFLNDPILGRIEALYDPVLGKFIFRRNTIVYPDLEDLIFIFEIDFNTTALPVDCESIRYREKSLGWMLGYRKDKYVIGDYVTEDLISHETGKETIGYVPESAAYLDTNYFMINVDDFNKNYTEMMINPFYDDSATGSTNQGGIGGSGSSTGLSAYNPSGTSSVGLGSSTINILGKIPLSRQRFQLITATNTTSNFLKREYFGPVNIDRLRVQLLDDYGRVVDLNNIDYSFTIEIEQIYDL